MSKFSTSPNWALASHNAGKIKELNALLTPHGLTIKGATELGFAEPEETEKTFTGNAILKAKAACEASGLVSLADDSGLSVDGLDGAPGIYSARWAGEPRDFDRAMAKVEEELRARKTQDFGAQFVCVLALAHPDGEVRTYEGIVRGHLEFPPRGTAGFGYDPIFVPQEETRTFAEMSAEEKRRFSHRGRAFDLLMSDIFNS